MSVPRLNLKRESVRRVFQLSFLVIFTYLTVRPPAWELEWLPAEMLSRFDPLVGLTLVISARALLTYGALALITVAVTLVFGRVWCGWLCPLGALIDLVPGRKRVKAALPRWWRYGKYVALGVILLAAALGTLWPMFLDPVTIVTRPLQELGMPVVGTDAVGQSVGTALSRDAIGWFALLSLVLLAVALSLNAVAKRFWCESVCPLGGLLATLSFSPGLRRHVDSDTCISCGKCERNCPTQAIDSDNGFRSDPGECIACLRCLDVCPTDANRFSFRNPVPARDEVGLDRREALGVLGVTGASMALTLALPYAHSGEDILRPPGTSEDRLAQMCVRCGACYSACPTGALRPSTSLTSAAGLWTPMLDERPSHCTLDCNLCAESCPTDALHTPTPVEARALGLGATASVDRNACVAWSKGHECMACQGVCPISGAIYATKEYNPTWWHQSGEIRVPHVDPDLCVACGQCTTVCPALPQGIRVER